MNAKLVCLSVYPLHPHSRHANHGNWGQHVMEGGIINNRFQQLLGTLYSLPSPYYHNSSNCLARPTVFDILASDFVSDALYDSETRRAEHAVTCLPVTRTKVLSAIRSWAESSMMDTTHVCWLSGPAGTGKSTVAHTIATEYDRRGRLAASFFAWRKTGDRDDINKLIATLAYQIAHKCPLAKEAMEENLGLENDPVPLTVFRDRLSKISLEDRLSKLLINKSIIISDSAGPDLVVIDGLDECSSREGVCQVVEWIRKNKLRFRFLLTSRPEPEIRNCFISGPTDVWTLSLTESISDIAMYFVKELEKVWPTQQRIEERGPSRWPSKSDLERLVEKSEGLFVYAATAVRYIGDSEGNPSKRLEEVLELDRGLDSLYAQVIEEARTQDFFEIVMGSLMYLKYPLSVDDLSIVLLSLNKHLTSAGILSALRRCHSILSIGEGSTISPYHASLRDFLTDESRASTLFFAPATCHGRLMLACLLAITKPSREGTSRPPYALVSWYYHTFSVLITRNGDIEGLGGMKDEFQGLVKLIDVSWVKSWLIQALRWTEVLYLKFELPSTKVPE